MFNDEKFFLSDSSESSEHANLPRVLTLHETLNLFDNTNINLDQNIKTLKNNKRILNKLTEIGDNKINIKNKSLKKNKAIKSKNKNKNKKDLQIIDINNKIKRTKSNFNSSKKMILKTDLNIKSNYNKNNFLIKSPKVKLNKNKDIKNSNNKNAAKTLDKNIKNKILNSRNNKLKNCQNEKMIFHSSNNDIILFDKKIKKNIQKYSRDLVKNISLEKINKTNTELSTNFNLTNTLQLKCEKIKENKINRIIQSSKILSSFEFHRIPTKKKFNFNNSNNNNIRLTLPPSKGKKKSKEQNKIKENEIKKLNLKMTIKNKIKSKIIKKKEDEKNNNKSVNHSHRKLEKYKTEKNNIKMNNKYISIENKIKAMRSFKDLLKQENKYNIKSYYVLSKPGKNEYGQLKINQDTYLFIKEINGIKDFDIFGVLDGHGPEGHLVSQLVSSYIQIEFQKIKLIEKIKDINIIYNKLSSNNFSTIKDLFINADNFLRDQKIESRNSGTTLILVIHIGEHIICANAGDSRAILIYDKNKNNDYKIFPLSIDSKPELKEEKERIKKMGGIVEKIKDKNGKEIGPYRVWNKKKEYPGLAMSRALGDFNGKNIGIIPDPKIIETNFEINIKYIVICSDGVWEFLKNEDILKLGNKYYEENKPREFCKEIYDNSVKCWQKEDMVIDDITILTVFF